MKSVPNLISYLHEFFRNCSQFLAIYFELFSSGVNFNSENTDEWVPPVSCRCPRWARLSAAVSCHAAPDWLPWAAVSEAAPVSFLTETQPRRAHLAPPAASHRTDPLPRLARLCLVPHPWLPRTLFPHACPEPTWIEFAGSLPTEDNENQILTDYLSILSPNPVHIMFPKE
jgi:hypothetical protein